ncbi:hypothetical protein BDA96_02G058100 [Sorghum bicolor]|uniref:Meg domain-containing protein n=2 Tax=Sorghum bicolor TaxID=4558 RepID=A0A921RLG6_SORBI|nr:protein MATERNALLY EXPRESSED GENE 1-like [Sorghum bicolor]KAG0541924.1 hypothetical protein BDA96_02G058100 [Sorghum bicolor]OQU88583.1 hypothetical protein SORBI_3002G057700 [Sorghum bicolor]|eukprot:XP_021307917.1 protein MATERNALLY EXPRESSED GENE 1-like [Sorghum bicolor]
MGKYTKRVDALVFFSLLFLGYFAAHVQGNGHGTDEVGAPSTSEEVITRRSGAQCAQNNRNLPCQDKKCFCCIGGRTHDCYYTLHDCKAPASKHKSRSLLLVYHVMAGNVIE